MSKPVAHTRAYLEEQLAKKRELEAQAAAMREALNRISDMACTDHADDEHRPDCGVGLAKAALASDAGRVFLERLEKAEAALYDEVMEHEALGLKVQELEAQAAAMREALLKHRADVWGSGPVGHDADETLYAATEPKP